MHVRAVQLSNSKLFPIGVANGTGGGSADMTGTAVDENENGAADAGQFSPQGLPAYGFYLRHAAGISFSGISITPTAPDARPLFFDGGNTDDISVDGAPMPPASVTSPK
jgi:hypothetical protein